jgi:hypothetical protein
VLTERVVHKFSDDLIVVYDQDRFHPSSVGSPPVKEERFGYKPLHEKEAACRFT